jgi:hypothetical protein
VSIVIANGSATISTTEYSLNNNSTSIASLTTHVYAEAWIDFSNMVAGDQYQIRLREKVNGGAQRSILIGTVTGARSVPWRSERLILAEGWDFTVTRTAGADRAIGWSIRTDSRVDVVATNAATISITEWSLPRNAAFNPASSPADDSSLEAWIDLGNLAAGDAYRVRFYETINGTQRVVEDVTPVVGDTPVILRRKLLGDGWDVTVVKVSGADRSIAWSIRKDQATSGGAGDTTPPTDSAVVPGSTDYQVAKNGVVQITTVDAASAIGFVKISVSFSDRPATEEIYAGAGAASGFVPPYQLYSSIAGDGSAGVGYTFSIRRNDQWPRGAAAQFRVHAVDAKGNVL